jgi:hypothetical protein
VAKRISAVAILWFFAMAITVGTGMGGETLTRFNIFREVALSGPAELTSSSVTNQATLQEPSLLEIVVSNITANRLGTEGGLLALAKKVSEENPFLGVGFRGVNEPFDSSWGEAYVFAGIIGLILVSALFSLILVKGWQFRSNWFLGPFAVLLPVYLLIASFGIGVFTANRASTLVWICLTLVFLGIKDKFR